MKIQLTIEGVVKASQHYQGKLIQAYAANHPIFGWVVVWVTIDGVLDEVYDDYGRIGDDWESLQEAADSSLDSYIYELEMGFTDVIKA